MTVVHLLPALEQGGVESVVIDLNRALVSRGCSSVVISRGGRLVERIRQDGGRHVTLDLKSKNPLTCLFRALALKRALERILDEVAPEPVIVAAHSRVPAWLFVLARKLSDCLCGVRWITYAHGANSVSRYSAVMTFGDLTIVPSRFLAGFLQEKYRISSERLRVVNPAVDGERFDPEKLDRAFMDEKRREWGLANGERVLMTVGRISPVKGLETLVRDFVNGRYRENRLVIVGGADANHLQYLDMLKVMASAANGKVVFAGPQSKVPECLALADTVISANTVKPESFGLSVVEAYAMGKPVMARRFGGVGEIMEDVGKLMASKGLDLRHAVLELYGFDRFADRTLEAYASLVK